MSEQEVWDPKPERKPSTVLWRVDHLIVHQDGTVTENGPIMSKTEREEADQVYLSNLSPEELVRYQERMEHQERLDEDLEKFRKEYPVGGLIDMSIWCHNRFGSLEVLDEIKEKSERLSQLHDKGRLARDGESEESLIQAIDLEIEELEERLRGHSYDIGDEALLILKTSPRGKIIYAFDGEGAREGDSEHTELLTEHETPEGKTILHYNRELSEYGQPTFISLNTVKDSLAALNRIKDEQAKPKLR